jgi:hypothetical protein
LIPEMAIGFGNIQPKTERIGLMQPLSSTVAADVSRLTIP